MGVKEEEEEEEEEGDGEVEEEEEKRGLGDGNKIIFRWLRVSNTKLITIHPLTHCIDQQTTKTMHLPIN